MADTILGQELLERVIMQWPHQLRFCIFILILNILIFKSLSQMVLGFPFYRGLEKLSGLPKVT